MVKSEAMSTNKASVQYKIPKGTLINKIREDDPTLKKVGPPTVFHQSVHQLPKKKR